MFPEGLVLPLSQGMCSVLITSPDEGKAVFLIPTPLQPHCVFPQAYIHTRMRAKTSDFLKVLNRARPDAEKKEMRTIT